MTAQPPPNAVSQFLAIAQRLALLDPGASETLAREARRTEVEPAHIALRQGMLTAVQIDIIEAILHPEAVVPGFEILDLIGQGGMGVVFRARQKSLDRVVALKTILFSQMENQTALTRFEHEAMAVARLRHPNIVTAFDLGRAQGRLYFVMELVEGSDVEQVLKREGAFDEETTWRLVRQAASGLSHAAAAGIIHRDIKPANLLLVDAPTGFEIAGGGKMVKIADFGVAFLIPEVETTTRLTSADVTVGSPHYIAPEQLERDTFDHRVDLYALGATAYHMLAGRPPFSFKTLAQIVAHKLAVDTLDVRANAPQISAASAELIAQLLQRDPDKRIGGYAELIVKIDRLGLGTVTRPVPAVTVDIDRPPAVIGSQPTSGAFGRTIVVAADGPNRTNRRRFLVGSTAGLALGGVGFWWLLAGRARAPSRTLVPGRSEVSLFDGLSLRGWHVQSGAWAITTNDEGGRVISGTDGAMSRRLVRAEPDEPPKFYRCSIVMQLHEGRAAGIEFGIDGPSTEPRRRYVAKITKEGIEAGRRDRDDASYVALFERPLPRGSEQPCTVSVERQPAGWWVFIDDRKVGVLPIRAVRDNADLRLFAEGGPVWFSDMLLQDLEPAASKPD
jgi:serine/threonine protein kinase